MQHKLPEYLLIINSVELYINYLSFLKKNYDIRVLAVHPQGTQFNIYNYKYYADRKQRQEITDYFNIWLELKAKESHIPFIDIWYDKPEMERPLFSEGAFKTDSCHIKNSLVIERFEKWRKENWK
jgi:hypothetical protein